MRKFVRQVTDWAVRVVWYLPVGVAFVDQVGTVVSVDGVSMQPTFNPASSSSADMVWVNKFSVKFLHKCSRGDVVVLWSPDNPGEMLIKRVVAFEGDYVYDPELKCHQQIKPGRCWIEGDNPLQSADSRSSYGQVHLGLLEGRVTHVVWPVWRCGRVQRRVPEHVIQNDGR